MDGHAQHDDAFYVPQELFDEWSRRDPIALYERRLVEEGILEPADLEKIRARIEASLDEDEKWAEGAPAPGTDRALSGVYADDAGSPERPWR
jgi:pyruvate dehydrogenase E1 component alpha subunit